MGAEFVLHPERFFATRDQVEPLFFPLYKTRKMLVQILVLASVTGASIFLYLRKKTSTSKKFLSQETTVLITGAGHGLGRTLAFLSASRGCRLVLWDINETLLANVKSEILRLTPEVIHLVVLFCNCYVLSQIASTRRWRSFVLYAMFLMNCPWRKQSNK